MKKYFIYCREITVTDDPSMSVECQKFMLKEYAKENNLDICGVFTDDINQQTGLNKMVKTIKSDNQTKNVLVVDEAILAGDELTDEVIHLFGDDVISEIKTPVKTYRGDLTSLISLEIKLGMIDVIKNAINKGIY